MVIKLFKVFEVKILYNAEANSFMVKQINSLNKIFNTLEEAKKYVEDHTKTAENPSRCAVVAYDGFNETQTMELVYVEPPVL